MTETLCTCGKPTAGAWLCEVCDNTFRHAIIKTGVYYHDLGYVEARQARYATQGDTRGTIGKTLPLPVDIRFLSGPPPFSDNGQRYGTLRPTAAPATQLRFDAWATVVAWCRVVMEHRPAYTGPTCETVCLHVSCAHIRRNEWPSGTIGSMVRYLARQTSWITSQTWVPVMLDEFLDIERRLARFVDRPPDRWYAGRCGADSLAVILKHGGPCTAELYAETDRGDIACRVCGTRHDIGTRRDQLMKEAQDEQVTATVAASALIAWTDYDGTTASLVDRIRKWRDRDHLEVRDVTSLHGRDRHLYRLGDIQTLLVRHAQTTQARRIGGAP